MEKEVIIAIIGALAVIGGAVIQSGILNQVLDSEEGGGLVPPSVSSLEPDKTSPQKTETVIMWTASATDLDGGRLDYKFSVKSSSADDQWVVGKDWGTESWWEWIPSEAGSYRVLVEVRDPDGNNNSMIKSYEIEEMAVSDESERSREPPVLKSLEPDKPSPQETGAAISWTAEAEDPDDTSLYYRFLLKGPSTGGSWDAVQDWNTQSWWDWEPSEAGSYQVQVDVRDGDHSDPEGRDDYNRSESYEIEEKEAEKVVPAFFSEEDPAVAVSSWGPGRLDLFVRGTDGALHHRSGNGGAWSEWKLLDEELLNSAPAAVSRGPDTIDVFAIGDDNDLMHKRLEGSNWSDCDWESLERNWTSAPAVSSWGEDRLDVFVRGTDNALWHIWWDGSNWSDWESLGGNCTSAPAAVSLGESNIHVFVRGTDDAMYHKYYNGAWGGWQSLDKTLTSAPAALSSSGTLHVFSREAENKLMHTSWYDKTWHWQSLGEKLSSAPAAVSWGPKRIDVFYKGADNTLMHKKYDKSWSGAFTVGKWPPE